VQASFAALLTGKSVSYSVLADRIGACRCEIDLDEEARKYIMDNPAEFKNPNCLRMA
jgi:hypothetical protein